MLVGANWEQANAIVAPKPKRLQLSSSLASIHGRSRDAGSPRRPKPRSSAFSAGDGILSSSRVGEALAAPRAHLPPAPVERRTATSLGGEAHGAPHTRAAPSWVGGGRRHRIRPFFAGPHARGSHSSQAARPSLDFEQLRQLTGIALPPIRPDSTERSRTSPLASSAMERRSRSERRDHHITLDEAMGAGDDWASAGVGATPTLPARHGSLSRAARSKRASYRRGPSEMQGWALVRLALRTGKLHASSLSAGPLSLAELSVDVAWHVRKCPLFAMCSPRQIGSVARSARLVTVPRYHVVYREGTSAEGGALVLLASGSVRLTGYDARLSMVQPLGTSVEASSNNSFFFGVEAAATDAKERRRADTATVGEASVVILISPELLPASAREQARVRANVRLLKPHGESHSVFGDLPPAQLRAVAKLFRYVSVPVGAVVIKQGEATDSFFELISGKLEVIIEKMAAEPLLASGRRASRAADGENDAAAAIAAAPLANALLAPRRASLFMRPTKLPMPSGGGAPATAAAADSVSDVVVDVVTTTSSYRHFGDGGFTAWMTNGKLGFNRRGASIVAVQPSLLLELQPQHFTALYDIVPGIIERLNTAHAVQERSHALKREQLGEEGVRRMLAEHRVRADERNKAMQGSRQYRLSRQGASASFSLA
ncbi:hypothetical protein KFE25_000150 [Diacronema lutheri]|uniref:Cyclic nucleotide-binding domain-containing protein n=1 Tax=Diacronema lutheri TaxID=2081491 RepID=A0A8J5XLQ4_DIALT|nr:hypothetical protein KFE25_000150 [Diacronema lutheri]